MTSISVASLEALNSSGVIKLTNKVALFADATASPVSTPFDGTGLLQAFPTGYFSSGLVTTDGFNVTRSIAVSTVNADQLVQPIRSDVTGDSETVQIKFIDAANQVVQALDNNLNISAVTMTPFFSAARRSSGLQPQRRLVLVAEDTTRNIVVVKYFGNVTLTATGNQVMQRTTELQYDHTFTSFPDAGTLDVDGLPSSSQIWIGGSGWAAVEGSEPPPPAWQATHAYTIGQEVTNTGDVLQATVAGTSGSTAPTNPAIGSTVVDGSVTWKRIS